MSSATQLGSSIGQQPLPATMQAAVYRDVNDVRMETVAVPKIGPGEILVRVHTCGICGTDLKKIATGSHSAPRIFGHETTGVVAGLGEDVVAGNIFAEPSNHPGRFMAKDARGGMGTGCNLLEIGAADAAGVDPNQNFSRADLRHRDSLHADVVHAAINRRLHGCGDRLLADGTTELGCARHVSYRLLLSIRCSNARHRFAEAILLFFLI